MHPLEKIIILLVISHAIQLAYLIVHAHALHRTTSRWYVAKMAGLLCVATVLGALVLRIFQLIPYIGI